MAIMYTSGTTGTSKGVALSHANAYALSYAPEVQSDRTEDDVFLVACPMFHNLGLMGAVYSAIVAGGTAHVLEHFSASRFWNEVDDAGITCTILVGTMCDFLMQQPSRPDDDLHSLRTVHVIPMPPYKEEMEKRFNIRLTTAFGNTESGAFITNVTSTPTPTTSVGKVRPGWTVRLVDEHDMEVENGKPGEAIVRSEEPWVMTTGYLNNSEATTKLWRNGWLHTGDVLERDAKGWFYFVDRVNHSIRRHGENISSAEVERDLMSHPEVVECAVMGVGIRTDQEVKAAVKRREGSGLTETELVHFAIDQMPYYAVPRYIVFVDEFPRTATGKIRKVEMATLEPGTWDREAAGIVVRRQKAGPKTP
jgi:crotonobetaine/carnitine-CoA ligase